MRYTPKGNNPVPGTTSRGPWEAVGQAPDAQGNLTITILRGDDGSWLQVPSSSLLQLFDKEASTAAGATEERDAAIKETLAHARTMSATRFVALPVFLTGSGVLAEEYATQTVVAKSPETKGSAPALPGYELIPVAGLILAVLFMYIETMLSRNLKCFYAGIAKAVPTGSPWEMLYAPRHPANLSLTRFVLLVPYGATLMYWMNIWFMDLAARHPALGSYGWIWLAVPLAATLVAWMFVQFSCESDRDSSRQK